MTELNGIDILCDAAGSDMLSSLFSLGTPGPAGSATSTAASSQQPHVKRVKLTDGTSSTPDASKSAHVCYICKRVYERADHLTRHLRSHENARQYQCSRCPKRFNRADLLTRHELTHDRDDGGKTRSVIRRTDRAAEACVNCASSKAKCDDQKPCGRCKAKNLPCRPPARKPSTHQALIDDRSVASPSPGPSMASHIGDDVPGLPTDHYTLNQKHNVAGDYSSSLAGNLDDTAYIAHAFQPNPLVGSVPDDMVYFNPVHNYFQDVDFTSFDLNFDSFVIPPTDVPDPSPQSTSTTTSRPSGRNVARDAQRGHAAFKRSPWLWDPETKDYVSREQQGLDINENSINSSTAFGGLRDKPSPRPKLSITTRDRLFAMVLSEHKDSSRVPSFPSLDLLNYLVQAHFAHEEHQCDSFIHAPTFNPDDSLAELLGSIIGSGATFISVPAIWQFGYAMQEIVRQRMGSLFESSNANTRNLRCLQAYLLELDIGIWSGFKRKTELAESFLQPIVTMIRRAGVLSVAPESLTPVPAPSDTLDVLESKWHTFIQRESYKRLVLHIFFHDVQASVSLQKNPLMSFAELAFCLPAARDLWKAPSAKAWRDAYLRKRPLPPDTQIPRMGEVMHRLNAIDELGDYVDTELCYTAVLHGFWGQISAYREAVKFNGSKHQSNHGSWLRMQRQELYGDLSEFSTIIYASRQPMAHLTIIAELFMMTLHVSLDDLTRFAGKLGVDEARCAAPPLEQEWATSPEARYAVWHAGQVLANARRLAPTSLRRFNAVAVYFAGLTLWTYGLLSSWPTQGSANSNPNPSTGSHYYTPTSNPEQQQKQPVLVDSEETRETQSFLRLGRGTPALTHAGGVESLARPGMILTITRQVFRDNFPVRNEPLPPLVESLQNLLRDLGSGPAGRPSRAASEEMRAG